MVEREPSKCSGKRNAGQKKRLHNFEEMRTRVVTLEAEGDVGRKEREDW